MKGNRPPLWHGAPPRCPGAPFGEGMPVFANACPPPSCMARVPVGPLARCMPPLAQPRCPPLHPQPLTLCVPSLLHHQPPPHATPSPPWGPHPCTANLPGGTGAGHHAEGLPAIGPAMAPCPHAVWGQQPPSRPIQESWPQTQPGMGDEGCGGFAGCARRSADVCGAVPGYACARAHGCACMNTCVHACVRTPACVPTCLHVGRTRVHAGTYPRGAGGRGSCPSPVPWFPRVPAPQHPRLRPARPPIKSVV